jgi:hypothetical protein
MYYIEYADGTKVAISRCRKGQYRWYWQHGGTSHATHLSAVKAYAEETGGKFVHVRPTKTARSGYPVGLANLLSVR